MYIKEIMKKGCYTLMLTPPVTRWHTSPEFNEAI